MDVVRGPGPPGASFSSSVAVTGSGTTVYISGQIGEGASLSEQTNACFDLIERIVAEHGGTLENVVRITAYLTSLDDYAEYARVRAERFGSSLPSSTAVQVAGLLAGAVVEIDAVAVLQDRR